MLSWVETTFVGGALAFASLLLFVNVVLRYWFLAPISWAEELTLYIMVWIVFVGSSVAIRTRGHIAIDLLPLALSPAGQRRLAIFIALTVLAFLAVFFHYSLEHTLRVRGSGQVAPVMQAPMWLAYLAMPAGSALMILRTCQMLWRLVRERVHEREFAMDLQD
ncbi:MAG: TRAP transporter small permease [Hyphomicrobiaceae bacterium]|nr:TRAP transporter small permease [Hyphomicrobiaceae bacterium]